MTRKKSRPQAAEKRCFFIGGRWYWKPDRRLRAAFSGVALGDKFDEAMRTARRLNAQAETWLASGAPETPGGRRREGPRSVGELINAYLNSLDWRRLRDKTREAYGYELRRLEDEFGHEVAMRLSRRRVLDWHRDLSFTSPETARHVAARGRMLFNWAAAEELIPPGGNPFGGVKIGQGSKRRMRIKPEDLRALIAACDAAGRPSIGTALLIGFACVQRISDVIRLRRDHIVRTAEGPRLIFNQSKSSHVGKRGALTPGFEVNMILPPIVEARLRVAPPVDTPDDLLIAPENGRGGPWEARAIARAFGAIRNAMVAAEPARYGHLAGAHLRDGRRSGFVQYILDGASVPFVCAMSGHAVEDGFRIVEHYLPKTPDQADAAVVRLSVTL